MLQPPITMADSARNVEGPTRTSADANQVVRALSTFLIILLAFDGSRAIAKLPGMIPQKEFKIINKANDKDLFNVEAYVGHKEMTFRFDSDVINTGSYTDNSGNDQPRTGSARLSIDFDYTDSKNHTLTAFMNPNNKTDTDHLSGFCLDYGTHIYGIEVAIVVIFMVVVFAVLTVQVIMALNDKYQSGRTLAYPYSGMVMQVMVFLCILYVALKLARLSMEIETFGAVDQCLFKTFEHRGGDLLQNYFDPTSFKGASFSTGRFQDTIIIETTKPNYTMLSHVIWLDITHIVVVLFLCWKHLNILYPALYQFATGAMLRCCGAMDKDEVKGHMGASHVEMGTMMQSAMLETLITN